MRVIALSTGFHAGKRRREGTEFDVPAGTKAAWFAPVGENEGAILAKTPVRTKKAKGATVASDTAPVVSEEAAADEQDEEGGDADLA